MVADIIRSLSPEQKEQMFVELLKEALTLTPGGDRISVNDWDGTELGYIVPSVKGSTSARFELPLRTPEELERTRQSIATLERSTESSELLKQLSLEDEECR